MKSQFKHMFAFILYLFPGQQDYVTGQTSTTKASSPKFQSSFKKSTKTNPPKKPASMSSVPNGSSNVNERVKTEFIIPELPQGRLMEMKIYSNWGDKYLVGLNGIELFDSNGQLVHIEKVS